MEFKKIVERLLDENRQVRGDDKKGVIAGNVTTNTGRYASAQVGTSAGVLAPHHRTAGEQSNNSEKSFAEKNNAKADDDTTTTRKSNATKTDSHKNTFKQCKGGSKEGARGGRVGKNGKSSKNGSEGNKGTIIKYKPVDFGGEWQWS